jgi:hypothetical protein
VVEVTVVVVLVVDWVSEVSSDFGPQEVRIKPREKQSNVFINDRGNYPELGSSGGYREFGRLFTAKVAGEKQNQEDQQDETETASAYHGATEVKSAAAEQEHQNNQDNK